MNSRAAILAEMGLSPVWVWRETPVARGEANEKAGEKAAEQKLPPSAGSFPRNALPSSRADAPLERERGGPEKTPRTLPMPDVSGMAWDALRETIRACRACGLCEKRKQAVPGVGDENAAWLFIGEGPGAEEDARGEPFVGQAGRLLDAMLAAIGLKRGEDVYIANAVKCRPPGNRTPEPVEMAACFPYLRRQIALIEPRLIVLLGKAAVSAVLQHEGSLGGLRGKTLAYRDGEREIPVLATYHPAYLLRNLPDKAKAWEDLCRARALMRSLGA